MLLVALVVVGLLIGWATGGRLSNLDLSDLRIWWVAPVALFLQFIPLGPPWALPCLMVSYLALVVFAAVNIRRVGMPLILLGLALNWLVIGLNAGMPVDASSIHDPEALASLITEGGAKHHLMTREDRLSVLGDRLVLPASREIYSIGDLALYTGVAWFVAAGMRRPAGGQDPTPSDWGANSDPPE